MKWYLTSGADWECVTPDCRYRIEEWSGTFWLYRKPVELSAYSELIGSYKSLEDAKEAAK